MHPAHQHMTTAAKDPDAAFERRFEIARQSVSRPTRSPPTRRPAGAASSASRNRAARTRAATGRGGGHRPRGLAGLRDPGHAPSHVCLHQRERGLLLSGDHLLGRVLYYDYGYTPDPAGEFLTSLDVVGEARRPADPGGPRAAGAGRPRARRGQPPRRARAARALRECSTRPRPAFELVPEMLDHELPGPMMIGWGLPRRSAICAIWSCAARSSASTARLTPSAGRSGPPEPSTSRLAARGSSRRGTRMSLLRNLGRRAASEKASDSRLHDPTTSYPGRCCSRTGSSARLRAASVAARRVPCS